LKEELTKANSALSGSTLESEEELNGKISKIQNNITKINKDSVSEQKKNQEELDNDIIKAQNNILKNENKDNITAVV
jgi:predicted RNA-binding protein with PIN domain